MNKIERALAVAAGLAGGRRGGEHPLYGPRLPVEAASDTPLNDAESYAVRIEPATVPPGTWYWRVGRVHHLTPAENNGNHHIYLDVWDGDPANGARRVYGARVKISLPDGEQWVTIDKPMDVPGTNFPLWKWQVAATQAMGVPGQELPADRVTGLSTAHPDEAPGNTLFHHSFHVVYYRAQAPNADLTDSIISGVVHGGVGHALLLTRSGAEVARQTVAADEHYRFEKLTAGRYRVAVAGTGGADANLASDEIILDGSNMVSVDLQAPPTDRPFAHYVLFGAADQPATQVHLLLAQDFLLAFAPAFGFSVDEAALAARVTLVGDTAAISDDAATRLAAAGAQVQRIAGTIDEMAAALAQRVAQGHAF
jgi:hypothetical protein